VDARTRLRVQFQKAGALALLPPLVNAHKHYEALLDDCIVEADERGRA
jgi:hypothetical protein